MRWARAALCGVSWRRAFSTAVFGLGDARGKPLAGPGCVQATKGAKFALLLVAEPGECAECTCTCTFVHVHVHVHVYMYMYIYLFIYLWLEFVDPQ